MTGIEKAREALEEAIEFADQDFQALTPVGEAMVDRWRAALSALEAEKPASVPEDVAGVVERLRGYRPANEWGDPVQHTICDEAASALARVAKERDEARATLDEVCLSSRQEWQRATTAEAKLAEARKVIDRYWKGAYWAAMADHDADVVNAFLEETK